MTTERDLKRFLAIAATVVLVGAIACAGFIAIIDPYRLYDSIEGRGFNKIKPTPTRYQNEIKLHGAVKRGADIVFLGNSRAELGFNPEHVTPGVPAYNLALAGTRLSTARTQLVYLSNERVIPTTLVVGLEFLDFLIQPVKSSSVAEAKPKTALDDLAWRADALFSIDSLIDSLKTLRLQRAADPQSITERGFNPLFEYNKFAREGGYYPIFQQRAGEYAKRFVQASNRLPAGWGSNSPDLVALRKIIAHGIKTEADVHLVIYPYHVQIMAMLEEAGLIGAFDDWKAMLVLEVSDALRANPGARVKLWDFSGYSTFHCEAIPPKGDTRTRTTWYWEAGHFKEALGQKMLHRMFMPVPQPFGSELNSSNLAFNQTRISDERAVCAAAQPEIFRNARALISDVRDLGRRTE